MASIEEDYASDFELKTSFVISGIPRFRIQATFVGLSSYDR
jgi:hypothetical protein